MPKTPSFFPCCVQLQELPGHGKGHQQEENSADSLEEEYLQVRSSATAVLHTILAILVMLCLECSVTVPGLLFMCWHHK